jgi:hypothetical protein
VDLEEIVRFISGLIQLLLGDTWSRLDENNIRLDETIDSPLDTKSLMLAAFVRRSIN